MGDVLVPVSVGELLDKISILEIKAERIKDAAKLLNVARELEVLSAARAAAGFDEARLADAYRRLKAINEALWGIEDDIRDYEARGDFGPEFIRLARAVYQTNDERSRVKKELNGLAGSTLIEEKSYSHL
jgi:hypothetical protein